MPTAITIRIDGSEMTSCRLPHLGNVEGDKAVKTRKMTTSAPNMIAGDELSPRRIARARGDMPPCATASIGRVRCVGAPLRRRPRSAW